MASREAAKSFCLIFLFSLYRNYVGKIQMMKKKEINLKNVKKITHSALIRSPGRWTGNRIILKDGLFIDLCRGHEAVRARIMVNRNN